MKVDFLRKVILASNGLSNLGQLASPIKPGHLIFGKSARSVTMVVGKVSNHAQLEHVCVLMCLMWRIDQKLDGMPSRMD